MYILEFDSSNKCNHTINLVFIHDIDTRHYFTYVFFIKWTKYPHLSNVVLISIT